jgi:zinc-ribbon domain
MKQEKSSGELAEVLGRKAGQLFKAVKPGLRRAFADAKPLLEKTGRQATNYAREHDAEIKQSAAKVVRARLGGPFGFLVDVVTGRADDQGQGSRNCTSCRTVNPRNAKFCSQCGSSLAGGLDS